MSIYSNSLNAIHGTIFLNTIIFRKWIVLCEPVFASLHLGTFIPVSCSGSYNLPSGRGQVRNCSASGLPGRSEYCGCWYQGESWNEEGVIKSISVFSVPVIILVLVWYVKSIQRIATSFKLFVSFILFCSQKWPKFLNIIWEIKTFITYHNIPGNFVAIVIYFELFYKLIKQSIY